MSNALILEERNSSTLVNKSFDPGRETKNKKGRETKNKRGRQTDNGRKRRSRTTKRTRISVPICILYIYM